MKKLLAVIVGVSVVLSAVGCSAKTESQKETKADEKIVITYWNGFTGTDGEVMQRIVDNYNESNQLNVEIQMERVSWDTLYQQLATSLPVGDGPDITAFATERIGEYAESGAIKPIDELYSSKKVDAAKIPAVFNENLQYNGNYYGVPLNIASLVMYYNKDIFDKAGVEYPNENWTWTDLEDAALKLTKDIDGEHQYGFGMATNNTIPMWPIMIWAGGGDYIIVK